MKKFFTILAIALAVACAFFAPRETANVLGVVAVLALTLFFVANISSRSRRTSLIPAVNTLAPNWGTHTNGLTLLSSAAVATRYLLGKIGADASHVAVLAATSDEPLGVMTDEASAAEEPINVQLLGVANKTVPVVAKVAITLGADLYATADGKVGIKPTAAGTYWRVGRALQAADAENDVIEMVPMKPRKLIVIAALGNANSEISALTIGSVYSQAEVQALRTKAEELADDVRAIAGALDGNADVALATT